MTPKVRAILDQVEDVLLEANQDSADLWSILTALRGPDDQVHEVKTLNTVPIRRAAFPRIAAQKDLQISLSIGADFGSDANNDLPDIRYIDSHFLHHIRKAVLSVKRLARVTGRVS